MSDNKRISWIDEDTQTPIIERYARQMDGFVKTFADGKVDEPELLAQEERLVTLMKEIEPQLEGSLHKKVTELLCELTSYDIMRFFFTIQQSKPKTTFRG
jgi:hypothetical protein